MMSADRVPAVHNAPFSAEVTTRFTRRSHDDSTQFVVTEESHNIARDANGRTYDDLRSSLGYQKEITGHIYDPSTRLDTVLIDEQHLAPQWKVKEEPPEYETNPKYEPQI